ncbi:MAG: hypothetical protein J1F03_04195 [Oscillospiraceae bacterium]|nr:hypothetical protein [Oscillospiraceae bacterium]
MIFREFKAEEDGWVTVFYTGTWRSSWDFILDAVQNIITDFRGNLQKVAYSDLAAQGAKDVDILAEVVSHGEKLRECGSLKTERGVLSAAGISAVMECPFQLVFFNQSATVRLDSPLKKFFDEHGEHVFDNYLNSVEIKAYCEGAVRNARNASAEDIQTALQ